MTTYFSRVIDMQLMHTSIGASNTGFGAGV